jgi:uncharacterized protein
MKVTICITQQCNLRCSYCYMGKKPTVMSPETARKVVDFIFTASPPEEKIDIGFFGGEPLLCFDRIRHLVHLIEGHASFTKEKVELAVVTNGTIFSDEIAAYLNTHDIGFCLSCDGPPPVQDLHRCFPDGTGSSGQVEETLRRALEAFPAVLVNAVYHPANFQHLPDVVEYFSALGLRQIYLNPDFTARWTREDAAGLQQIYDAVAERYIHFYLQGKPHYISFIDSKIAVILRDGYDPLDRCRMGRGELAFAPSGNIYPCERLIGADDGITHCIGSVEEGFPLLKGCGNIATTGKNVECQSCPLSNYCMNWCGCSNYFQSGRYDFVGPFLCASERAAITTSFHVLQVLEEQLGSCFYEHLNGAPTLGSIVA